MRRWCRAWNMLPILALHNIPDVRADKVEQLKNQIENGTYEIKSEEIAEKMLKDSLLNDLS